MNTERTAWPAPLWESLRPAQLPALLADPGAPGTWDSPELAEFLGRFEPSWVVLLREGTPSSPAGMSCLPLDRVHGALVHVAPPARLTEEQSATLDSWRHRSTARRLVVLRGRGAVELYEINR